VVLGQIKALLDQHLETTLPGGKLGQALGYLGNQWLCNFFSVKRIRRFDRDVQVKHSC
jgi:hypothetical protein